MRNAEQVVEQEFLQVRAKILEIAAFFDRLESDGSGMPGASQERLRLLRSGCELLQDSDSDKAARVQLLFSRKYDEQWRKSLGF